MHTTGHYLIYYCCYKSTFFTVSSLEGVLHAFKFATWKYSPMASLTRLHHLALIPYARYVQFDPKAVEPVHSKLASTGEATPC